MRFDHPDIPGTEFCGRQSCELLQYLHFNTSLHFMSQLYFPVLCQFIWSVHGSL